MPYWKQESKIMQGKLESFAEKQKKKPSSAWNPNPSSWSSQAWSPPPKDTGGAEEPSVTGVSPAPSALLHGVSETQADHIEVSQLEYKLFLGGNPIYEQTLDLLIRAMYLGYYPDLHPVLGLMTLDQKRAMVVTHNDHLPSEEHARKWFQAALELTL